LVDIPRSPDSFPVQNEVEGENPSIRPRGNTTPSPPFETIHTPQQHPPLDMLHFPSDETPTVGRSQPPARENEDKVVAAMENERSPDRRIYRRVTARTHGGDEVKAVEAMPRSDLTSPASIQLPRAQHKASAALAKQRLPSVEGILGYKGPGLLKSMIFQRKYFWFRHEKDQELAEKNAALSSRTGKGLLCFGKGHYRSRFPAGSFSLVCSNLAKHE
jgi:hypothetical protein